MINVTLANFEAEVLQQSDTVPVLVDFWAPWCGPCKTLGPLLEKLETEYQGRFVLAKVDSDQEQQLAGMFGVRSVPTCVLLVDGQPVDGFMGALPESQLRQFLDKHLGPSLPPEHTAEPAVAEPSDPASVLERLQHTLAADPANDTARFDYVKLLLQQGRVDDAKAAFAPMASKAAGDRRIDSLQRWIAAIDASQGHDLAGFDAAIAANKRDFAARFGKAQWLMAHQQWPAAMDELLEILMRDKGWEEDQARKTYIAILELIEPPRVAVAEGQIPPEDPTVASYRRRLSSVVLS